LNFQKFSVPPFFFVKTVVSFYDFKDSIKILPGTLNCNHNYKFCKSLFK